MEKTILNLNLNLISKNEGYKYNLHDAYNLYGCNYEFTINANINEDIVSLLNNEKEIIKSLKDFVDKEHFVEIEEDIKIINDYLDDKIDIKNNIEYISIDLDEEKDDYDYDYDYESFNIIRNYIDNNMVFFKDKKIVIHGIHKINEEQIKISNEFFGNYDNIYYIIEGNSMPISNDDYRKTVQELTKTLANVKEKQLSPLENLMYLYDIIRNRKYKEVENLEEANKSRDITSVLTGEYIVCVGFTELFDYFAKKLGFRTYQYLLTGKKESHVRNLIYVNDPKYDVDGIYFFDVTWDAKKKDNNEFLYRYKHFMKTKSEMETYDACRFEVNEKFNIDAEIINELKKYPYLDFLDMESIKKDLLVIVGNLSKLLKKDNQLDNIWLLSKGQLPAENIISLFEEYLEKSNKPFELDKFCELLYNVRKIQNQENPKMYPFSNDVIKEITINSKLDNVMTREERLLCAIFGETEKLEEYDKKINDIEKKVNTFDFGKIKKITKK